MIEVLKAKSVKTEPAESDQSWKPMIPLITKVKNSLTTKKKVGRPRKEKIITY